MILHAALDTESRKPASAYASGYRLSPVWETLLNALSLGILSLGQVTNAIMVKRHSVRRNPIHIGTSGWHYQHWKGPFYPEDLPSDRLLAYYADYFQTVEINNTFYHLPTEKAMADWRDAVPAGFIFAVKASRYITHMKKLKEPQQSLSAFLKRVEILGDKLGPILFQLPPYWHFNLERLKAFLPALPRDYRYAFEFRDQSWINESTDDVLAEHNAAFCIYDIGGEQVPKIVTSDLVYVRLHGPEAAYAGKYPDKKLAEWAEDFLAWERQGREIYCYFDNDEAGYAVQNALTLNEMVGRRNAKHHFTG